MQRHRLCAIVGILFSFLSVIPAFGQGAVAEINGTAADQTGAILPGATITITDEATGLVRTAISNESGRFVIAAVTPGRYTVKAELSGFQTQAQTGIVAAVGQAITLNFTLLVGTLTDTVTVTGEAPLIEVTQSQLGQNISQADIENLPMQGREQFALLQLVPGLTPNLQPGSFEGAAYNANGRDTGSNLFLVDGQYNKDDRTMTFPQSRVTVDSMAEFQVLTHEYGAEYGGASGVIVNAITKSGTNQFHGRLFSYLQDDRLNATNYFLKLKGEKNPDSGSKVFGGNIGGPIIRNKAFWFFNYEYNHSEEALNLSFPPAAAPLAVSFSDVYNVHLKNYFVRGDYQFSPSNTVHGTLIYGPNDGIGENAEAERSTREGFRHERAAPEVLASFHWTSVIGTRLVNEVKVGTTKEALWIGDGRMFNEDFNDVPFDIKARAWTGLRGIDPLDFGSAQQHPDYLAGPRASNPGGNKLTANVFSEQITYTPSNHTFKFGWAASQNNGLSIVAANQIGTFEFLGNQPFNPAVASTYPTRFRIRLGEMFIPIDTWRTNVYAADKWQIAGKLTLNLGVRYDYDANTPRTKDGFAPRLGAVYAPNARTAFRVGFGKFYEYPPTAVISNLYAGRVISPVFVFDTGEDTSPTRGVLPAHPCLLAQGRDGMAVMSAACRAQLVTAQNQLAGGGFVNTEPVLPGNRELGFLYQLNAGFEREVFPGVAVVVDYVGSRGRDQTGRIDINEPRLLANGLIGRPGPAVFDPDGSRVPASARTANFQRVLEYTTSDVFNSKYDALEVSMERRLANRWSGRLSYTLSKAHDVNAVFNTGGAAIVEKRVNDDLNPRLDYGLTNFDNRHTLAAGGSWNAWRDLGLGATFRYYSGNPVNETTGVDGNRDRDGANFDRPVRGIDDATLPIRSPLDANGMAIRNGLKGEDKMLLDLRLQYVHRVQGERTVGLFWEIYNATNRVNFANPIGNRRSADFLRTIVADEARSMQLGVRLTF